MTSLKEEMSPKRVTRLLVHFGVRSLNQKEIVRPSLD